ncbi:MAG TPA: zinc-dependent metalloprotease, partial [Flavobacteriales bacterium]|nr:zinc-dependent metalloprotease [Flavobacteriales bacterium]
EISPCDPRYQSEDLSDNSVKASEYGVKNLQRIVPKLPEWTKEEGESYKELAIMYNEVIDQFKNYIRHVTKNVGGIYDTPKTYDMPGESFEVVPRDVQKNAVAFLNAHVFTTPTWLLDANVLGKIKPETGVEAVKALQATSLNNLLAGDKAVRLMETSTKPGTYSYDELITDLRTTIFSELKSPKPIDIYKRNLQKVFTDKLIAQLKPEQTAVLTIPPGTGYGFDIRMVDLKQTDMPSIARANLELIKADAKATLAVTTDKLTKYHLNDLIQRIDLALNPR